MATTGTTQTSSSSTPPLPRIGEFYRGKSVLVTGATGFLGKCLLERLLRDCGDLKKIYVLVRPAKDKTPAQRMEEILQDSLFDLIRKQEAIAQASLSRSSSTDSLHKDGGAAAAGAGRRQQVSFEDKVVAVAADLAEPQMGVKDEEMMEEMRENVSIILHMAATVNFNEKLDISLATNVVSVQNLIK